MGQATRGSSAGTCRVAIAGWMLGTALGLLGWPEWREQNRLANGSEPPAMNDGIPTGEILERRVISWKPPLYHGWPTLARTKEGELLLAFSGGRERHVCPFGRLEWMRSKDGGLNWGWPQVLYDSPIDDRDAGVMVTKTGTIIVTQFTSLAYESILEKGRRAKPGESGAFETPELLAEWEAAHQRLGPEERKQELGCYLFRSEDGGRTWSERIAVPLNSPHGPIVTRSGRLLYAGKSLWSGGRVGICESFDDGRSWEWIADIPIRDGDKRDKYHELHMVETRAGRWVCQIRNENASNPNETLQSESDDGGRTWSVPHPIGVWGLPSHLLLLKSGSILMTYGHRRPPLGIQARISKNDGSTWSDPLLLSEDGASGDLGYPSTVELDDGVLVTVWYEKLAASPLAQLRQARWKLKEPD